MKSCLFEWKKMHRLRLVAALIAATFLLIGALYVRNFMQQDLIPAKKIEPFAVLLKGITNKNDEDQRELQKKEDSETAARLEAGQQLAWQLNELLSAIENGDGQGELQHEIEAYQLAAEYKTLMGTFPLSQAEMDDRTRYNKELDRLDLAKEDTDLSIAQPLFMKKVAGQLLSPVGFLAAVLLIGAAFTKEWEDRSMQFSRVLPVPAAERISARLISYWLASLVWLVLVFGISALLPYAGGRTDKSLFKYPFVDAEEQFTATSHILGTAGLYAVFYMLFAFTLFLLAGSFFRQGILTVLAVAAVIAGGWIVTSSGAISVWNPFLYQQPVYAAEQHGSLSLIGPGLLAFLSAAGAWLACLADRRRAVS